MVVIFLMLAVALTANWASAEVYVDWEVRNPGAGGYLTVSNYPQALEYGQTYKVEFTLTVEWLDWGDSVEFQMIHWLVETGENQSQMLLGYSSVDSVLKKHEKVIVSSHWSLRRQPVNETGRLSLNATVVLWDSTQPSDKRVPTAMKILPPIQVSMKVRSQLTLALSRHVVEKGQPVTAHGSLGPAIAGVPINLTYVKPNGDTVCRWATTDLDGYFSDEYTPDVEGTWSVKASWIGSEYYTEASSDLAVLRVDPQPPIVPVVAGLAVLLALFGPSFIRLRRKTVSEDIAKDSEASPFERR